MATGKVVGYVTAIVPPAGTTSATPDIRVGGSTPAEHVPVWDFDGTTAEYLDLYGYLQGYDGGGLTVTLVWGCTSATSGSVAWGAAVRAIPDDAEDVDAAHTYAYNYTSVTVPNVSGEFAMDTIAFTDGADMDSAANNAPFVLRITRDPTGASGTDDVTTDAEFLMVIIKET